MKKATVLYLICFMMAISVCFVSCTYTPQATHSHTLVHHDAKEASCTEDGNIEYYSCKNCSGLFTDSEGKNAVTRDKITIASGHSYSDKWSSDDEFHWHAAICEHTNEVKDKAAHNVEAGKCSVCNKLFVDGKSTALATPTAPQGLSYEESISENLASILQSANAFANKLTGAVYGSYNSSENFAISPVSVYMALAMTAECADETTRDELLSALGVTYDQLVSDFNLLYRSLNVTYKYDENKISGMLDISNSIWLDKHLDVKQPTVDNLADKYYSYPFKADFLFDNAAANSAIQDFVKEKTRGLIDRNFELNEYTVFALINTLYFKDNWNFLANLEFTEDEYTFNSNTDNAKSLKFLQGDYKSGRVCEAETFTHFYTSTVNGYKLKFIVPKSNHTIREVFTPDNIATVNSIKDYKEVDQDNKNLHYFTRCLFPEFTASYDDDLIEILKSNFNINTLFDEFKCNFSSLTDTQSYCSKIIHATELKVNKTGIEGAAVTIEVSEGSGGPNYTPVFCDYVIDRSFGFIITDSNDTVLFTGVVENV